MRRTTVVLTSLVALAGGAAPAAAQPSSEQCVFERGTTTCESVEVQAGPTLRLPGSRPGCTLVVRQRVEQHTYTAHRGAPGSRGTAVQAPAPWSATLPEGQSEECTSPTPSISGSFGEVREPRTFPGGGSDVGLRQGSVEYRAFARGLRPSAPVQVELSVVEADGTARTLMTRTETTFSDGAFGTGHQGPCAAWQSITLTFVQGDVRLSTTGVPADAPSCRA